MLNVTFFVSGRYLDVDWAGVQLVGFSRQQSILNVKVALSESLTDDPVTSVLDLAEDAVEFACGWARARGLAEDLPEMREELRRLRLAGPAPVRHGSDRHVEVAPDQGDLRAHSSLQLVTDSGELWDDASEGLLDDFLDDVLEGRETGFRLQRVEESAESMQVSSSGHGVRLVRGGQDGQFVADVDDPELAREAIVAWAFVVTSFPSEIRWT